MKTPSGPLPQPHPSALVSLRQIAAVTNTSTSFVKHDLRPRLPDPIVLGTKTLRWRWRDVAAALGIPAEGEVAS